MSAGQIEKWEDERGHQGQDGPFLWYEQWRHQGESSAKKAAQQSYHPLKLGCEKKYSRGLWLV